MTPFWFVAAVSFVLTAAGLYIWRRDRAHLLLLAIGPVMGLLVAAGLGWEQPKYIALICGESLAVSVAGYWMTRYWFSPAASLISGGLAPLLTAWILAEIGVYKEAGMAPVLMLPIGIGAAAALTALFYAGRQALQGERPADDLPSVERLEEKKIVLDMLSQGKVSAAEATELLDAVRQSGLSADRLPITGGIVASLLGGIVVVIGWAMPWSYGVYEGVVYFRAGYSMSFHGWLVLVLGVVPALLACLPVLDKYLRQGMVRLFLGLIGMALSASLLSGSARGGEPSSGLALCLLGFCVQVVGALKESGIVRGRPRSSVGSVG